MPLPILSVKPRRPLPFPPSDQETNNPPDPKDLSEVITELFSDVAVTSSDGYSYDCHKIMLAGSSGYMHQYLSSTKKSPVVVKLPGIQKHILEYILRYIYDGEVWIIRHDVLLVAEASIFLDIPILQESAFTFLARAFNEFRISKEYKTISVDNLELLLNSSKLCANSENDIFLAVEAWINHDPDTRTQHIERLMECVQFELCSVEFLYTTVVGNKLMVNSQVLLNSAILFHMLDNDQKNSASRKCQSKRLLFHPGHHSVSPSRRDVVMTTSLLITY